MTIDFPIFQYLIPLQLLFFFFTSSLFMPDKTNIHLAEQMIRSTPWNPCQSRFSIIRLSLLSISVSCRLSFSLLSSVSLLVGTDGTTATLFCCTTREEYLMYSSQNTTEPVSAIQILAVPAVAQYACITKRARNNTENSKMLIGISLFLFTDSEYI